MVIICRHAIYNFRWGRNKSSEARFNSADGFERGGWPSLAGKSCDWFQAFGPLKHDFLRPVYLDN